MLSDPIFEAIRRHRLVHHDMIATRQASASDSRENSTFPDPNVPVPDRERAALEAAWELLSTPPASLEGLIALADYALEFRKEGNDWPPDWETKFYSVIMNASLALKSSRS